MSQSNLNALHIYSAPRITTTRRFRKTENLGVIALFTDELKQLGRLQTYFKLDLQLYTPIAEMLQFYAISL
jgi:hypothetical protein